MSDSCESCGAINTMPLTHCEVCLRGICRKCKPHWYSRYCSRCMSVESGRIKELKALEAKRKKIMAAWAKETA